MNTKHLLLLLSVLVLVLFGISIAIGVRSDRDSARPEAWIATIQKMLPMNQTLSLDEIESACLQEDRFILSRNQPGICEAAILPSKTRVRKARFTLVDGPQAHIAFEPASDSLALPSQVTLQRFDLRLIPVANPDELPREGASLIIVGLLQEKLHFRIFDSAGAVAVDAPEAALPKRVQEIKELKQAIARVGQTQSLSRQQKESLAVAVTSILDYSAVPSVTLTFLAEGGKLSIRRPATQAPDIVIHVE
jgi:hypothetical protein